MGTQGPGRKRHPNRERLSAEDQALNHIAREAEARLAAKRAARAEAREIRMKELERQQKEIYQVQKKYYGLDAKWGDIEQWMEDSERYSYRARRTQQGADDDDVMSVGSRSSLRTNGYEEELLGATQYRKSSRSSTGSGETYQSSRALPRDESTYYSDMSLASAPLTSKPLQAMHNGNRPSLLNCNTLPSRSQRGSLYDDGIASGSRRYSSSSSKPPSEYSCYLGSGSRASSRASSARASPVNSEPPGSTVFRRGSACGSGSTLSHGDDISVPPMFGVEERPEKDFSEKGSRPVSSLSAATLASLGGTSSRRGSGDTSISVDTEASIREIKDSLAEVEEKYKRSMVTNAQLDNEKSSLQYQVDTLRDVLLELEEELAESRRQHEEKNKECERQKHEQNVLRFQLAELKDALEQREQLLTKHGIALDSEDTPNGDASIEPHIIEECHMESPQKATALGKADESDVTEQEMSLMSQRSQTEHEQEKENEPLAEQDREEEQEKSPEEFPFQAENNVATDFQRIQELKSENPDELKQDPSADDGCSQNIFGQSLSQQREDCKTVLKHLASEEEGGIEVEVKAIEGKGTTVEHITSVVDGEVAQNQRGGSPGESEVFQDALDFVKQTQNVTECVCETAFSLSSDMKDNFQDQKAENMEEDHDCTVESAEPVSGSEGCEGIVNVREASSCSVASEESADQTSSDSDDFRETGENVEIIGSKVDHEIPKENVFEFTPNESSLNVQIQQETEMEPITTHNTEEALPALESEKKPGDEDNEIIKKDKFEISTHKEETTKTFKENEAEAVEVFPPQSLKLVLENEAVTSVACDSNPSEDGQAQCHFIECTNVKVDREKLEDGLVISDSEKKEQIYSDAGLESSSKSNNESFNLSEGENVIPGEQKGQKEGALDEADKEESMTQNADESECKQAHTELLVTKEEVKNEEKDDLEDENHDEENGSNEEEEDHDEEEDNGPSEKYQGESEIRLGSSVDMTSSMEDVRSEVSTNKSIKLVKGKNKEDCVIS
ncbi:leucine-rich repeat flightless-interacting protein 1 isoform X16 [Xenopus laevis]|uniref:Leucine-rich repeat flightless-interacting protein 1 isoform X16 n=1 Tax=Xenopus laevis TaxID=8355 RepID=A0A8J0TWG9_XENLA|nr:leucine-rich repeat flightless-interacting protein 1 isoform X16 [Xenopus laevis]